MYMKEKLLGVKNKNEEMKKMAAEWKNVDEKSRKQYEAKAELDYKK